MQRRRSVDLQVELVLLLSPPPSEALVYSFDAHPERKVEQLFCPNQQHRRLPVGKRGLQAAA